MHPAWEFLKNGSSVFSLVIAFLALAISALSLGYVLYDRRSKLVVRARKGDWYVLDPALKENETLLRGVIEIYNHSARPNTVCGYYFWIDNNGMHEELEGEMVELVEQEENAEDSTAERTRFNVTPLLLAPYAGVEARIHAIIKGKHVLLHDHLRVMVEVEDVFGKRSKTVVKAKRSETLVNPSSRRQRT
jgi:hypothetical protein